eukprot:503841_1
MGNNNCCGCNENPNMQKKLLMKQKVNINKKPKQTNKTQKNKHITNKEFESHEASNNEDKISKLDLSAIKTEFYERKSVKDTKTANKKISMKQTNLAHQNTPITSTKAHVANHNEDKYSSDEASKMNFDVFKDENDINKCDKNNINNNPIDSCKPVKRLISSLKYYEMLDIMNNKDDQNIFT